MRQRFLCTQKRIFKLIRQKTYTFSTNSSVKSATIGITLPKVCDIYHGGLWGIFSFFSESNWTFISDYMEIHWHTSCRFQLELRSYRNKKSYRQKACDIQHCTKFLIGHLTISFIYFITIDIMSAYCMC